MTLCECGIAQQLGGLVESTGESRRIFRDFSRGSLREVRQQCCKDSNKYFGLEISRQGNYAEAVPLNERATEIWMKALGPEHPTVATALNGVVEHAGENHQNFPGIFLWCSVDVVVLNNRALLLRAQVRAVRIFQEFS